MALNGDPRTMQKRPAVLAPILVLCLAVTLAGASKHRPAKGEHGENVNRSAVPREVVQEKELGPAPNAKSFRLDFDPRQPFVLDPDNFKVQACVELDPPTGRPILQISATNICAKRVGFFFVEANGLYVVDVRKGGQSVHKRMSAAEIGYLSSVSGSNGSMEVGATFTAGYPLDERFDLSAPGSYQISVAMKKCAFSWRRFSTKPKSGPPLAELERNEYPPIHKVSLEWSPVAVPAK